MLHMLEEDKRTLLEFELLVERAALMTRAQAHTFQFSLRRCQEHLKKISDTLDVIMHHPHLLYIMMKLFQWHQEHKWRAIDCVDMFDCVLASAVKELSLSSIESAIMFISSETSASLPGYIEPFLVCLDGHIQEEQTRALERQSLWQTLVHTCGFMTQAYREREAIMACIKAYYRMKDLAADEHTLEEAQILGLGQEGRRMFLALQDETRKMSEEFLTLGEKFDRKIIPFLPSHSEESLPTAPPFLCSTRDPEDLNVIDVRMRSFS